MTVAELLARLDQLDVELRVAHYAAHRGPGHGSVVAAQLVACRDIIIEVVDELHRYGVTS